MCKPQMTHQCGCHGECDCTIEDKVQMLELSKQMLELQIKSVDRRIVRLKEPGAENRG